jgi:hypothetical protein
MLRAPVACQTVVGKDRMGEAFLIRPTLFSRPLYLTKWL